MSDQYAMSNKDLSGWLRAIAERLADEDMGSEAVACHLAADRIASQAKGLEKLRIENARLRVREDW